MGSAEEELKRRRERGRLAQSAFRKRQTQAKQDIKAENDRLKNAIAEIIAQSQHGARPELREKIRQAAAIAGLDVALHPSHLDSPVSPEHEHEHEHQTGTSTSPSDDVVTISSSGARSTWLPAAYPTTELMIRRDPFHCYKCTEGALVVLPFLGSGAFTFAGRIFWHLIEKHEALVHAQDTLFEYQLRKKRILETDGLLPAPGNAGTQMALMDLVSAAPSVQNAGPETWLALIEERMDYYRDRSKHIAANLGGTGGLHPPIVDSSADEAPSRRWLSPFTAEKRVREIVGDDVFALLAQPVVDRAERRKGEHTLMESTELIDFFLDTLADTVVCHGNGPHWDAGLFDDMFRGWLRSVTGGQLQPVNPTP